MRGAAEPFGGAAVRIIGNIFLSLPYYPQPPPYDGNTVQGTPSPPTGPCGLVHRDCRLRIHRMQQQRVRWQYKRGRNIPLRERIQRARDGPQRNPRFGRPAGTVAQHHKIHPPGRYGIPYAGIPRIVIETENRRAIKDRETEIPARLQIWGEMAPKSEIMELTIRGRGNSSWTGMPKKSYKIEF